MRRGKSGRVALKVLSLQPFGPSALTLCLPGYGSTAHLRCATVVLWCCDGPLQSALPSHCVRYILQASFLVPCHEQYAFIHLLGVQGITQVIDAEGGTVQNIADFRIANSINGYLNVEGTVAPVEGSGEAVRVDVKFTAFCLKIGALPQLKVPLGWSNPSVSLLSLLALCDISVGCEILMC